MLMRIVNFVMNRSLLVFPLCAVAALFAALSTCAADTNDSANLAVVATPTTSFASPNTTLMALNDDLTPRSSGDRRQKTYGNWPSTNTEWVQYEWSRPISTKKVDVYWWADGNGVGLPKACRLLYWNGSKFVPVN